MRRTGLFARLKSTLFGTAIFALVSFGFQSVALPVHASAHAAQLTFHSHAFESDAQGPRVIESACDLCSLATHQAISVTTLTPFDTFAPVAKFSVFRPSSVHSPSSAVLPPVRGPPSRA